MPSNIVINNGAATPVAKTFTFAIQNGLMFQYNDMSAGTFEGFNILTIQIRPSATSNQGHRVSLKLKAPVLAVTAPSSGSGIQPNPTKAYESVFMCEFMLPKAASLENRKDIMAFAKNLLALSGISALVTDLTVPA